MIQTIKILEQLCQILKIQSPPPQNKKKPYRQKSSTINDHYKNKISHSMRISLSSCYKADSAQTLRNKVFN